MASIPNPPPLVERADVHKSCKSLETLLNILNDYCEAAGAVVLLQKKLVKALREAAGSKTTGPIPANALNSSATIFETLSDIDAKFAKLMDKEYDSISAEVKKWFKKLAKEEKAHDDWITNSNTRIKQAGLAYEKKSKKNPRDADEEHARYINLLSTLGPEINQEKYNHSLQVTQRHTHTTYSVAACLSRIADAEWVRTCEGIRRISPTVGQLGEWKALCEGEWVGPIPSRLPDVDETSSEPLQQSIPNNDVERTYAPQEDARPLPTQEPPAVNSPLNLGHPSSSAPVRPTNGTMRSSYTSSSNSSAPPSSFEPPRPLTDPNTGSVRSLSAFPVPPTHFPIPPRRPSLTQRPDPQSRTASNSQEQSLAPSSSTSNISFPSAPRLTESPIPDESLEMDAGLDGATMPISPRIPENSELTSMSSPSSNPRDVGRPLPSSQPVRKNTAEVEIPEKPFTEQRAEPPSTSRSEPNNPMTMTEDTTSVDTPKVRPLDRTDTGTSIVATMKDRITSATSTSVSRRSVSPPPKDIPRLPLSVVDLASRYQPGDGASPTQSLRANSPPVSRRMSSPPIDTASQARLAESAFREITPLPEHPIRTNPPRSPASDDRSRSSPLEVSAQSALAEKERQLRLREREIELKAKELEQDRARFMGERAISNSPRQPHRELRGESSSPALASRERHTSFDNQSGGTPRSQQPMPRPQYSYSTTHLVPPSSPISPAHSQRQSSGAYSQYSSQPPSPRPSQAPTEHAPYCGCDKCSIAKYRTSPQNPSATDLRPPERPIQLRPEKSKGWIRRLSMPVGNPFSLDHKRNHSAAVGNFSLDGRKSGQANTLKGIQEDGRLNGRVNYDIGGGVSNRSVSSLALGHDQR